MWGKTNTNWWCQWEKRNANPWCEWDIEISAGCWQSPNFAVGKISVNNWSQWNNKNVSIFGISGGKKMTIVGVSEIIKCLANPWRQWDSKMNANLWQNPNFGISRKIQWMDYSFCQHRWPSALSPCNWVCAITLWVRHFLQHIRRIEVIFLFFLFLQQLFSSLGSV